MAAKHFLFLWCHAFFTAGEISMPAQAPFEHAYFASAKKAWHRLFRKPGAASAISCPRAVLLRRPLVPLEEHQMLPR